MKVSILLGEIRVEINKASSLIMYNSSHIAEKKNTRYMENIYSLVLCWGVYFKNVILTSQQK